jgi:nickel/cobalt exporter
VRGPRRLAAAVLLAVPAFAVLSLVAAPAASAHPLGNFTVNHYDGLLLSPGHVRVTYVLDMAEIPTFQQRASIDANADGMVTDAERQAWAAREAAEVVPQLSLQVDGHPVALSAACRATMAFRPGQGGLPVLRMVSVLDATVPSSGALAFRDGTFDGHIGWKEVTAAGGSGVTLAGSTVPATSASDELLRYPVDLLSSPLAVTQATLSYRSVRPDSGPLPCSAAATDAPKAATNAFAALVTWHLTPPILLVSLLLAFAFGVVHALGPGHGKTITAAYLVGAAAKPRQAVGVGAAVASMHTASVLALGLAAAALSASFPSERIYPWLTVATGAFALTLGLAMLTLRLRANRAGRPAGHEHTHPWDAPHGHIGVEADDPFEGPAEAHGAVATLVRTRTLQTGLDVDGIGPGHHDGHDHDHDHDHLGEPGRAVSRPRLLALAVSGGILPSPTALVVLLAAISAHRVGYGLALIVAFSVGLASALIAIGILALRARSVVGRRLGSRVAGIVPILSALVIVGFGVFFLVRGAFQVGV